MDQKGKGRNTRWTHRHLREESVHYRTIFCGHVLIQDPTDLSEYDDKKDDDEEKLPSVHA